MFAFIVLIRCNIFLLQISASVEREESFSWIVWRNASCSCHFNISMLWNTGIDWTYKRFS